MRSAPRNLDTPILLLAVLMPALASSALASTQDGALAADHSLSTAINKADQPSVEKLLDPEIHLDRSHRQDSLKI